MPAIPVIVLWAIRLALYGSVGWVASDIFNESMDPEPDEEGTKPGIAKLIKRKGKGWMIAFFILFGTAILLLLIFKIFGMKFSKEKK